MPFPYYCLTCSVVADGYFPAHSVYLVTSFFAFWWWQWADANCGHIIFPASSVRLVARLRVL